MGNGNTFRPAKQTQHAKRVLIVGLSAAMVVILFVVASVSKGMPIIGTCFTDGRDNQTQVHTLRPWDHSAALARRHFPTDVHVIPRGGITFDEFLQQLKVALDMHQLRMRPVEAIFNREHYFVDVPHPACRGLWLEFGVFMGGTLNATAEFRERYCGEDSGPVYGFDTFTGLPEAWTEEFEQGAFSLQGELPPVRANVQLVKGLFSETLPTWTQEIRHKFGGTLPPITYLHVDCDLYQGARDIFSSLGSFIAPGCVLIFDELLHYPDFREHEAKAFWQWLQTTGRQVSVIGMAGPVNKDRNEEAVDLELQYLSQKDWKQQSVAFIVL